MSLQRLLTFWGVGLLIAALLLPGMGPTLRGLCVLGGLGLLIGAWYISASFDEVFLLQKGRRAQDEDDHPPGK